MFHRIPQPMLERMQTLEQIDARDRRDGTPRLQRLRQVPPETGRFLALLAAGAPAGHMIEIGTSAGYSTLWLALACLQQGRTLTTFELLPEKADLARQTFRLAGVETIVSLVEGDARPHLTQLDAIAFCFLDAEKEIYAECYEAVVPRLVRGGRLVADNAISYREALQPILDRALADERLDALVVPIGKGVLVCQKLYNSRMTWYIVRHAEKELGDFYNPRLRHQDQPISQKGREDAQKLCSFFAEKQISAIYVSNYQRTQQTIEEVAGLLQLAPLVDARLNEIDNGCIEGLSDQELHQEYPDVWTAYRERKNDFRFPGGETGAEAQQRIINFLAEKLPQHGAENIILVSHDGLIRLLLCHIMNIPVFSRWNFRVDTCGIMEVAYQSDFNAWKLIRFNQVCL